MVLLAKISLLINFQQGSLVQAVAANLHGFNNRGDLQVRSFVV
jgi:hypothetical protein